jgi:signal transduction histidine kinase/ActR/RegA family two-component response regulator
MVRIVNAIRNSLAAKTLLAIVAIGIGLVVLISAVEIWQEGEGLIAAQKREAQAAVRANIDTLALAVWSFDQRALDITARSLIQGTSIFRVEVIEDGETQIRLERSTQPTGADYFWEIPLVRPNTTQTIGTLRLWENYDAALDRMKSRAAILVVTESTKVFVISVLLFFVVHRAFTRPLSELARKVQHTAGQDDSGSITVSRPYHKGHDEIDALVEAINVSNAARKRLEIQQRANQAREAHAGKLEALGRLAGGIAHDFNNILGAILGFGGLLSQDVPAGSTQQRFAQRILSACERGKELVEQIRAFARAEGPERRIIDLSAVMRQNESLLSASLPKSTRLKFECGGAELPVFSSEARLGQLIANLCINASEALEGRPGSVTVEAGRAGPGEIAGLMAQNPAAGERFDGNVDPSLEYVRLRVSDTGPGIPHDILDRIFDPFFTTKGRQRGTGLGLAVAHGVIESHGGACHVMSRPGEGTIFSVYLPLAAKPPAVTAAANAEKEELRGHERILIVDDEQDIVDMLSIGLGRLGYETVGVNDPIDALAAFEEDPMAWDVVVTDQVMPAMRGLELIRKLKAIRPDIRAVLCTGYSDGANENISRAAGADAFLLKPLDAMRIAPSVRKLMDGETVR